MDLKPPAAQPNEASFDPVTPPTPSQTAEPVPTAVSAAAATEVTPNVSAQNPETPLASGQDVSAQVPYQLPKKRSKKLLVLIILFILILAGGGAAFVLLKGKSNPVSKVVSTVISTKDVVDRTDGTLDVSKLIDKQASIKAQSLKGKLNQQINLSDGFTFMVTKVERNWQSTDPYSKPDTGKEFIKVSLVVGNRAKDTSAYISSLDFQLRNSAGSLQNEEFLTTTANPDQLEGSDVPGGKQQSGSFVYQVDKNEQNLALVTKSSYTAINSSSTKVELSAEVAL